eukprot:COSAG02_NODE_5630_length_4172_cov_3.627302_2_plen_271_part_00
MRRDEVEAGCRKANWAADQEEDEHPPSHRCSKLTTTSCVVKDSHTPPPHHDSWRHDVYDRFGLSDRWVGLGNLRDGEKQALYPPTTTAVEADAIDRVSLVMGWITRLCGERRDIGGLWVPPPVLATIYENLSRGHLAFGVCQTIRDTTFPFPYAELTRFLLVIFCLSFPFVAVWAVPAQDGENFDSCFLSFMVCMLFSGLNEVAKELEVPFHVPRGDLCIEERHGKYVSMLDNLHENFCKPTELGFHDDGLLWETERTSTTAVATTRVPG